jgi:hydrogenase nickel incorporation protein HypB
MEKYRVLEIKESVFASNDKEASLVRSELKEHHCYMLNVMSSPGSGKTTLLVNLINRLKTKLRIGVMEADIDSDVDCATIVEKTGVKAIQLHTAGECHLTAQMTKDSLDGFGIDGLDLVIIENIGNLVCPAEFDTGATKNLCILSVPEGDDKPLKYPLMFQVSNIDVISKIDTLPVFDFNVEVCKQRMKKRNPNCVIFPVSAKTNQGMDELAEYLYQDVLKAIK